MAPRAPVPTRSTPATASSPSAPAFARAVEDGGLVLVGPSADVMEQMGRKDAAREIAVAAGVPVVPRTTRGAARAPTSPCWSRPPPAVVARACGSSAAEEYDEAVAAAQREAPSAFGDDTMLIEKYVEHGRHIEVQVLADTHGKVVHLFERDCSTQRATRRCWRKHPRRRSATRCASVITVVGGGAGPRGRLRQRRDSRVPARQRRRGLLPGDEHPPPGRAPGDRAACRTAGARPGRAPARVAAGEPLAFSQDEVALRGHAIEARVYAEDSFRDSCRRPGRRLRALAARGCGSTPPWRAVRSVSTAYDPMLGKVIAPGPTASRPGGRWSRRSTTPRSSGSPPTPVSCGRSPRATSSGTRRSTPRGSTAIDVIDAAGGTLARGSRRLGAAMLGHEPRPGPVPG